MARRSRAFGNWTAIVTAPTDGRPYDSETRCFGPKRVREDWEARMAAAIETAYGDQMDEWVNGPWDECEDCDYRDECDPESFGEFEPCPGRPGTEGEFVEWIPRG